MAQQQKDLEKVEAKFDGSMNQLRSEMEQLGNDMRRMFEQIMNKMDSSNSIGKQAADSMGEGSKGNAGLEMETLKPDSVGMLVEPLTMGDSTYKHYRYGHLDCPKFDGTNFPGWIMKLEQFFEVEKVLKGNKIRMVMM